MSRSIPFKNFKTRPEAMRLAATQVSVCGAQRPRADFNVDRSACEAVISGLKCGIEGLILELLQQRVAA